MSTFTKIEDAVVALSTGKLGKVEFIAFAKSRQWEKAPILGVMGKGLELPEVLDILNAHTKMAEEAAKKAAPTARGLYCKVGDKGTIGVYGLMIRFPVSLYVGQWLRLIDFLEELKAFIAANLDHPAVKKAEEEKAAKKS